MSISARNNFCRSAIFLILIGSILILQSSPINAYPIVGQEIYYYGGAVQIEILPNDAGYTSQIYLQTDAGAVFLGNSTDAGLVTNFSDLAGIGITRGDELTFGIYVINTGYNFLTGSGYENPDGIAHALVDYVSPYVAIIGFEDLFGGGDLDFNDAVIRVAGNIGFIQQIPEPSTMLLFGTGLAGIGLIRRRIS